MARIAGINIPMNKHVSIGLTHIFGVGRSRALEILEGAGVAPTTRVKDLTDAEVAAIRSQLTKWPVEGDLRREVSMNIKRPDGSGHLARHAAPQGPAGSRPADAHQCPHPQGSAQAGVKLNAPPGKA